MKKAMSLMEVLIAVVLITVVIATLFEIKKQNLFFLDNFSNKGLDSSIISIWGIDSTQVGSRNKSEYLKDVVDFDDDDIRRELKEVKVEIKDDDPQRRTLEINEEYPPIIYSVYESKYTMDNKEKSSKVYYSIKIDSMDFSK